MDNYAPKVRALVAHIPRIGESVGGSSAFQHPGLVFAPELAQRSTLCEDLQPIGTAFRMTTTTYTRSLRANLFGHLDGLVVLPTLAALQNRGVHIMLMERGGVDIDEFAWLFEGNVGYLNVALRLLASQGWMTHSAEGDSIRYELLPSGREVMRAARTFDGMTVLLHDLTELPTILADPAKAQALANQHAKFQASLAQRELSPTVQAQLQRMLEGMLAGPLLVHLAMNGAKGKNDHRGRPRLANIAATQRASAEVLLRALGWLEQDDRDAPFLSTEGGFFAQRASAYGVTVSYLHTMARLDELLFGKGDLLWDRPSDSTEIHVDRTMNVWGSGGAHAAYFKQVDELVVTLFNRPIEEQPLGFADMGSGDGTLIAHLFDLIHDHTLRGKLLKEHPLLIVGADYNAAAREATRATLAKADVWGEVMFGDVSDPARLANDLREQHGAELGDLLNLRTFIDHNRVYREPAALDRGRVARSTGAFAFRGKRLDNRALEQDLCDHLRRWAPYLERFGLLVIELHTLPPALAAANPGATAVSAYDGTHGYSDQYIVEHSVFLQVAQDAGLRPVPGASVLFPSEELPVISVNLLKA